MDLNRMITWIYYFVIGSFVAEMSEARFSCVHQVCHECSPNALDSRSMEVGCSPANLISEHWLENIPKPPVARPEGQVDYACIKMTASDPNIVGDSTDIIKGCVLRLSAEQTCHRLVGIELARGKQNAKCWYCYGDSCNGASAKSTHFATFLCLVYVIRLLIY